MAPQEHALNFVGDVMLGRLIDQLFPQHVHEPSERNIIQSFKSSNPKLSNYNHNSPWGDTTPLFRTQDLNLINLETAATTHVDKWPDKVFNYRMHPANITALHAANIHYAGLANNHTLDFREAGLVDTVNTVKEAGVAFAGAGHDEQEATRPAILQLPSSSSSPPLQVYIWAASDHPSDWSSIPNFHSIDYTSRTRARIRDLIAQTSPSPSSSTSVLKVFSCHWGPNYAWCPSQETREFAHFLVDECGIDIVHGHSSHHVQGVEAYKGKLVIYGCGDFVDDYALVEEYRNDLGGVWRVVVQQKQQQGDERDGAKVLVKRLEMFPTKIEKFAARRLKAEEEDARWVRGKVKELSEELGTEVVVEEEGEGRIIVEVNA